MTELSQRSFCQRLSGPAIATVFELNFPEDIANIPCILHLMPRKISRGHGLLVPVIPVTKER